jgi:XTP/dITP diphosphohydrolase
MSGARRVVLASDNQAKLRELGELLSGLELELLPQAALGISAVAETGTSFAENALIKARHASRQAGLAAIADDSGLMVDALDGAPGIRSARYAGEKPSDQENIRKLIGELADVQGPERTARFVCTVAYVSEADDPSPTLCEGVWEGRISESPGGDSGFGYDPVFFIPELGCTAAELDPATKNELSHRGRALRALRAQLEVRYPHAC